MIEYNKIVNYLEKGEERKGDNGWESLYGLSLAIYNIYNGMEDIMKAIAHDIDGSVPQGENSHQDLFEQI